MADFCRDIIRLWLIQSRVHSPLQITSFTVTPEHTLLPFHRRIGLSLPSSMPLRFCSLVALLLSGRDESIDIYRVGWRCQLKMWHTRTSGSMGRQLLKGPENKLHITLKDLHWDHSKMFVSYFGNCVTYKWVFSYLQRFFIFSTTSHTHNKNLTWFF